MRNDPDNPPAVAQTTEVADIHLEASDAVAPGFGVDEYPADPMPAPCIVIETEPVLARLEGSRADAAGAS
eukprot:2779385-Rhodomonas_salina.3